MHEISTESRLEAEENWRRARRKVLYQEVICFLRQCPVDLLSFDEVRTKLHLTQKMYRGLQEIPLDRIRGSVGRYDDFTSAFLPRKRHLQERWERVDVAMVAGRTPPIDVYQVGESYFVLDGNHRVSIARQRGLESIEAYVWEFPTPYGLGPEADVNELLIRSEQIRFLAGIGQAGSAGMREIVFTCPGCYGALADMIERYRQGLEQAGKGPVSAERAASAWYEDIYQPAIEAIRSSDLLAQFPKRSEADLFIWAWENNKVLEELAIDDEDFCSTPKQAECDEAA